MEEKDKDSKSVTRKEHSWKTEDNQCWFVEEVRKERGGEESHCLLCNTSIHYLWQDGLLVFLHRYIYALLDCEPYKY